MLEVDPPKERGAFMFCTYSFCVQSVAHLENLNKCVRMWDTFYGHSAYIQIAFVACQELAASLYSLTKSVPDPFQMQKGAKKLKKLQRSMHNYQVIIGMIKSMIGIIFLNHKLEQESVVLSEL